MSIKEGGNVMIELNRVVPFPRRLECTTCGAEATAACSCTDPIYKLAPGERAARAVAADPAMSDRAIAEQIGVGHRTVGRARQRSTGSDDPVEAPRTGRDGRTRRQPTRTISGVREMTAEEIAAIPPSDPADHAPTEEEAEESYQQTLLEQAKMMLNEMSPAVRRQVLIHVAQMALYDRLDEKDADAERMTAIDMIITLESGRSFRLRLPTDRE
jgi:hypothetical protein